MYVRHLPHHRLKSPKDLRLVVLVRLPQPRAIRTHARRQRRRAPGVLRRRAARQRPRHALRTDGLFLRVNGRYLCLRHSQQGSLMYLRLHLLQRRAADARQGLLLLVARGLQVAPVPG